MVPPVGVEPFPPALWLRVNDHFRRSGQLYDAAPRGRAYEQKARRFFRLFPDDAGILHQAAYLVKNLVNLQRFPDANKRTASVLLEFFLESRGLELTCTNAEYLDFLLRVQRTVPPAWWDGRTFSLREDRIPLSDDAYHTTILDWLAANTKKKM